MKMKRIHWAFVMNTVARVGVAGCSYIVSTVVLMVALRMLPATTELESLRRTAIEILAGLNFGNTEAGYLVMCLAISSGADALLSIVNALRTNSGITKEDYRLMACCANVGCSLSLADDEGYIAVGADGNRFRLRHMADVEHFLEERENNASVTTAPVSADTYAHAGGVL